MPGAIPSATRHMPAPLPYDGGRAFQSPKMASAAGVSDFQAVIWIMRHGPSGNRLDVWQDSASCDFYVFLGTISIYLISLNEIHVHCHYVTFNISILLYLFYKTNYLTHSSVFCKLFFYPPRMWRLKILSN